MWLSAPTRPTCAPCPALKHRGWPPWTIPTSLSAWLWAPTLGYADVDAEVLAICGRAVEVLESLGAEVIEVETVFDTDPVADFLTVMGVCQLRTMRPFMGHPRWEEIDPVLRAIVDAAQSTTAEELVRVFDRFHRMNLTLIELFHEARILVTPTCAGVVPLVGEGQGTINGALTPNWAAVHVPLQHDPLAGRHRVRRAEQRRAAGRAAVGGAPARRSGRVAHGGGSGGRPVGRRGSELLAPVATAP